MGYCQIAEFPAVIRQQIVSYPTNENCSFQEQEIYNFEKSIKELVAEKDYKSLCYKISLILGLNMNNLGSICLFECIIYLYENNLTARQKHLAYKKIGSKYGLTTHRLKENMRYALDSAIKEPERKLMRHLFSAYDGRQLTLSYSLSLALESLNHAIKGKEINIFDL